MRGRAYVQQTFVGPVSKEDDGRFCSKWVFLLLQGPTSLLKLEYDTKIEAQQARELILKQPSNHPVPWTKLLLGIQQAFQEVADSTLHEHVSDVVTDPIVSSPQDTPDDTTP